MARTLPWKKAASSSTPNPTRTRRPPAVSGSSTPRRRRSPGRRDEDVNTTGVSTPERRARMRSGRSPSTSPPPGPPDQEPMREGYAADDIYMMVEDEFQSTAKLYTQHLHHAEYKRLQRLAREREAAAPARPPDLLGQFGIGTDGPTRKRSWRPKKDSDDEDNLAVRDPTLAGLLDSPRKQQVMLRRERGDSSSTPTSQRLAPRSPIATAQSHHDDILPARSGETKTRRTPPPAALEGSDTDDGDDLDSPVRKQEARLASRPPPASSTYQTYTKPKSIMAAFAQKSVEEELEDEDDLHLTSSRELRNHSETTKQESRASRSSEDVLFKLRARKAVKREKAKTEDEVTLNDIPTFMY